jgi:hypothetical protein
MVLGIENGSSIEEGVIKLLPTNGYLVPWQHFTPNLCSDGGALTLYEDFCFNTADILFELCFSATSLN